MKRVNPTQGDFTDKEIKDLRFLATKNLTSGKRTLAKTPSKQKPISTHEITLPSGKVITVRSFK